MFSPSLLPPDLAPALRSIAEKVFNNERISNQEAVELYRCDDLSFVGLLANHIREKRFGDKTFFNKNFHIEPTNLCIYSCKFCSYARNKAGDPGAWEHSIEEIKDIVRGYVDKGVTEVHIVGGVHPRRDLHYYGQMIQEIKKIMPQLHVKAFTAVELEYMIRRAKLPLAEGLAKLMEYGLDSIPGGGAEIFDEQVRKEICGEKSKTNTWLEIHETAHKVGLPSNATMLYGHVETYEQRVDHMDRLRQLQDRTGKFNTFIPLKYRNENNELSHIGEVTAIEDLKNYAVSRIYLDNFDHIKAYWPMIGKDKAQLSLGFGVDDIDGTIDDTTKIYSMAGAEDQRPTMTTEDIVALIRKANRTPVERDTVYNEITVY